MSDISNRNINALLTNQKAIRADMNDLFGLVENLQAEHLMIMQRQDEIQTRINQMMVKLYSGGATSGNHN